MTALYPTKRRACLVGPASPTGFNRFSYRNLLLGTTPGNQKAALWVVFVCAIRLSYESK